MCIRLNYYWSHHRVAIVLHYESKVMKQKEGIQMSAANTQMLKVAHHAFISMWQQHNDATLANPLRLTTANELVKDTLRCVGKVAELSLPNHQCIRIAKGVAHLKTCHRVIKQTQPYYLTKQQIHYTNTLHQH